MNYLWGKFQRSNFLKEINFSLFVIAVLMSFFASVDISEYSANHSTGGAVSEPYFQAAHLSDLQQNNTNSTDHLNFSNPASTNWYSRSTITD